MASKKQLVAKLIKVSENPNTSANRAKLMKLDVATLESAIAKAQRQQAAAAPRKTSKKVSKKAKKTSKKVSKARRTSKKVSASARSRVKKGSLPRMLKSRVLKIVANIRAGNIVVKQGKAKPGDMAGDGAKARYLAFAKLYKGVRKAAKKGTVRRVSEIYKEIRVSGKKPYFLSSGYHVKAHNVGGGRRGQGIVRVIPGSKATPFGQLNEAQKRVVVAFLNSSGGRALRAKGAPVKADYDLLVGKKGAASRWW
jgi:hypothetical protein